MDREQARELIQKYNEGRASKEEIKLLENWYVHESALQQANSDEEDYQQLSREMWLNIQQQRTEYKQSTLWPRIAAAAAIIIVVGVGISFYQHTRPTILEQQAATDIGPGKTGATLTLADGKRILLKETAQGTIASQSGVKVTMTADGVLLYDDSGRRALGDQIVNTLTTAKSEQYQVVLPDGSKVWLNAASSLKFPANFAGFKDRKVELVGEAYFEVSKSDKKFQVLAGETIIEVLGTHFNVNAYPNEPACDVTLAEGSVKVKKGMEDVVIKPGEQARVSRRTGGIAVTSAIDVEALTAWKDGRFKFADTDLKGIMRQLERWYDVEVDEHNLPDKKFNGTLSRKVKLSEVLAMIELTSNLRFKIEGRKVIMK